MPVESDIALFTSYLNQYGIDGFLMCIATVLIAYSNTLKTTNIATASVTRGLAIWLQDLASRGLAPANTAN